MLYKKNKGTLKPLTFTEQNKHQTKKITISNSKLITGFQLTQMSKRNG